MKYTTLDHSIDKIAGRKFRLNSRVRVSDRRKLAINHGESGTVKRCYTNQFPNCKYMYLVALDNGIEIYIEQRFLIKFRKKAKTAL